MSQVIINQGEFSVIQGQRAYMEANALAAKIGIGNVKITRENQKVQVIFNNKWWFTPFLIDVPSKGQYTLLIRDTCEALGWSVQFTGTSIILSKPDDKPKAPLSNLDSNTQIEYVNNSGSFTASDTVIQIVFPGEKPITLNETSTISYSIFRDIKECWTLGRISSKGYSKGMRRCAGSMILTVFDKHAVMSIRQQLKLSGSGGPLGTNDLYSSIKADELPPFDIIITLANETGGSAYLVIYGVQLFSDGKVISIEDMYIENIWEYVARDVLLMRPIGPINNLPSYEFMQKKDMPGFSVGDAGSQHLLSVLNKNDNFLGTSKKTFTVNIIDQNTGRSIPNSDIRIRVESTNTWIPDSDRWFKTDQFGQYTFKDVKFYNFNPIVHISAKFETKNISVTDNKSVFVIKDNMSISIPIEMPIKYIASQMQDQNRLIINLKDIFNKPVPNVKVHWHYQLIDYGIDKNNIENPDIIKDLLVNPKVITTTTDQNGLSGINTNKLLNIKLPDKSCLRVRAEFPKELNIQSLLFNK